MTDNQSHKSPLPSLLLLAILALGNGLLLAPAGSPLRVAGTLALLLLPGLAWTERLFPTTDRLTRWAVGAGLSYTLAMTLGLILHYLPGPIPFWAELATLNVLALVPWLGAGGWGLGAGGCLSRLPGPRGGARDQEGLEARSWRLVVSHWPLILLLAMAAIFRFVNLGYSEFQGDEALAMITAAEALEGHQDALFLRGKGPGEVLLPMILWRLAGTINEPIARLPFAIAGLLMVLTTYSLGRRLLNERAGLVAAGLLALNGFMIGFSRIVQYQTLVVWMSALALLCAWEWRESGRGHWAALTGAFLGAGLLAHYDAILVIPAIAYVQISNIKQQISNSKYQISNLLIAGCCLLVVAGLFYIPYALDPQAARTRGYLGDRIGNELLKNNLGSFLHFNVFYNSFYYVILTGLFALGFLAWALRSAPGVRSAPRVRSAPEVRSAPGVRSIPGGRYWIPVLAVVAALGLVIWPDALRIAGLDLAVLPFALILLGAFLSSALEPGQRAVVAWLAVPFLGYNFAVALPLTHIYTIVPAWTLLAACQMSNVPGLPSTCPSWLRHAGQGACAPGAGRAGKSPIANQQISNTQYPIPKGHHVSNLLIAACYLLPATLFSGYLYTAYLRHDVELWQDWPESQPALYWSPYDQLPPAGFFGFAHRSGWKEVGALYASGVLNGDYGSNEEPDITTWYTRGAPRACDPEPEYYFIADDLVDPWPVDLDVIEASYQATGRATLSNGKGLTLYQTRPATTDLGRLETRGALAHAFDRTATSAAFARSARGSHPADANLGGIVRLIGYDVDTRRARPGGRVAVTLYWQAQVPISDDYHVFVHLEGDREAESTPGIWGQADGRPVCWTYPTFDWRPGQIIADQHATTIKPDTPPGDYPILVGMYLPETGARLEVLDEAGEPVANSIKLTTVSIR